MPTQIETIAQPQLKKDLPDIRPGDTVRVNTRVIEGEKERIQAFEGVVIARSGGGLGETFTVRKISYGIGVERTFPIHSPRIESIKVVRRGRVRRAKLYYLRDRVGKRTRIKDRRKAVKEEWLKAALPQGKPEPNSSAGDTAASSSESGEAPQASAE